jgi:exosome complex exonuclease RRP6
MQDPVLGMAVEIPFVPASQRKVTQVIEDSIVVVGQARQKKRKRTKTPMEDADPSRSVDSLNGKKTRQEQGSGTPKDEVPSDGGKTFDFSVVPNILDNNPDLVESPVKKKKQRKQKNGMSSIYEHGAGQPYFYR